ncbi:hypothetical protein INR49_003079 [Caranx melampygus]|nr:hypothetical protein INR49_003079 [Caranx melampygus]
MDAYANVNRATTTINCAAGSNLYVGAVDEEYIGDVEVLNGIEAGSNVKLVPHVFPTHLEFLELSFTVGDTSATVRTKKPLDADQLSGSDGSLFYSVMCDSFSKYNNSRTLKVNDINDNGPVFEQKSYTKNVLETQAVDSEILRVTAVDADGSPENKTVTYSLEPASDDFMLTNSGAFILKRRLNYNLVQKYNFVVTAEDKWGLSDTATVLINVVDFDNLNPVFSHNLYQAFIPENQRGSFRTIVPEAIEAQDGDKGINVTLTYSISAVSPDIYLTNFNMDRHSGVVSVVTAFDREEMNSSMISINIKAAQTDDNMKTADAVVSVTVEDVNDEDPAFDQSDYDVTLLENSPNNAVVFKAVGGFVGTLHILPESVPFSISPDGTVTVKNSTALDREATEIINFQIEARETSPPSTVITAPVKVTLLDENDNSPKFTSNTYEGKVFANQTVGMLLVQITAEDPDAGVNGQIKYSIDFGNNDGYFSINEDSGAVSLAKTIPLVDNNILTFPLYVTARDGRASQGTISRSSSTQVVISAPGDSKPQFLQKVFHGTVTEEQEPGVFIVKVGFLAITPVTLRVDTEADKFDLSSDGELTTKVKLDYDEAPRNYSVDISISGGGSRDTAVVKVQVIDVNDNSPVFASGSITKSVPEDAEVGTNVTDVPATDKDSGFNKEIRYSLRGGEGKFALDPVSGMVSVAGALDRETKSEYSLLVVAEDQGPNGRVSYSIFQQNPSSDPAVFELDSTSGALRLVQPLDYSKVKEYQLKVQASDGGTPPLVGNSSVVVRVKDVNNNPPVFSKRSYDVAVSENLASGASILTLEVTDKDEGGFANGHFLYTSDTFEINKQGVVSLRRNVTLDRETTDRYTLQVVAVDQETDGLSATAQLNVTVQDYNDNSPQFPVIPEPLQIPEGNYSEESPREIVTIKATDVDLGLNGQVTVSLLSPHPLFRITKDGTLLAVGQLDRESREEYELLVKASDRGSPQRENITTVTVSITDVNDNRPEFSSSSYVSSVLLKDAEEGKLLLTLSATDRDAGDNARITYSLPENQAGGAAVGQVRALSGSDIYDVAYAMRTHADLFSVDAGGSIVTKAHLDKEKQEWYILDVEAVDTRTPPTSATAVVRVQVEDVNEPPQFESELYKATVFSIAPYKTSVTRATDPDMGEDGQLSYSLSAQSSNFDMDPSSGLVYVVSALDLPEEVSVVEVKATDGAGLQAATRVEVEVKSASGGDLVSISLNQLANVVEKKLPELEKSLGSALGWTVEILQVRSSDGGSTPESRGPRAGVRTLVSFISTDGDKVVSSEEVTKKLQSQSAAVTAELVKLFGEGLHFDVELRPQDPTSNHAAIIALAVLLALSIVGLIVAVVFVVKFKKQKHQDSDKENYDISRISEGYTNSQRLPESEQTRSEDGQQSDDDSVQGGDDSDKSHASALGGWSQFNRARRHGERH